MRFSKTLRQIITLAFLVQVIMILPVIIFIPALALSQGTYVIMYVIFSNIVETESLGSARLLRCSRVLHTLKTLSGQHHSNRYLLCRKIRSVVIELCAYKLLISTS
jgi:hypothetical protein